MAREIKKESCEAGFSACGGSRKRHSTIPPQCDPRGALSYGNEVSYTIKRMCLAHSRAEARLLRQPSTPAPSAHPRRRFCSKTLCGETFSAGANNQCFTITFFGHFSAQIPQPYRFQDQSLRGSPSLSLRQPGSFFDRVYSRYNLRCTPSSSQDLLPWSYMPPDTLHRKEPAKSVLRTCCDTFSTCLAASLSTTATPSTTWIASKGHAFTQLPKPVQP